MPLDRVEIDYQRKAVAVGIGDSKDPVPAMRAAFREGIGCVVMGVDQTFADIDKLPKLEMAPVSGDASAIPWPDGDLVVVRKGDEKGGRSCRTCFSSPRRIIHETSFPLEENGLSP